MARCAVTFVVAVGATDSLSQLAATVAATAVTGRACATFSTAAAVCAHLQARVGVEVVAASTFAAIAIVVALRATGCPPFGTATLCTTANAG